MPSNDGAGAKGALALLAFVALIVLAIQVMDQIAGEWRREYSGVWLLLAMCAGVALLALFRTKRQRRRDRIRKAAVRAIQEVEQEIISEFLDFAGDPAREAWGFKDADWQREAERWLADNEYGNSPEMARQLAAVVKHHYWEEMGDELNEVLKDRDHPTSD